MLKIDDIEGIAKQVRLLLEILSSPYVSEGVRRTADRRLVELLSPTIEIRNTKKESD